MTCRSLVLSIIKVSVKGVMTNTCVHRFDSADINTRIPREEAAEIFEAIKKIGAY